MLGARIILFCGLVALLLSAAVSADSDDEFIYQLGGETPLGNSVTNRNGTERIGGAVAWNTDLMCGNFDINFSIQNQLNGVSGAFQNLMDNVLNAATGVVASLPALVLQRLNPALYDLIQNGILQASEEFHLGEINCQNVLDKMQNTSESESWDSLAVSRYWSSASQEPDQDILLVEESADEEGMDSGIAWLGGEDRGGAGQSPIEVVRDTTIAGYNLLLNRAPDALSGSCDEAAICATWETSTSAADWMVRVLGEKQIRTCTDCEKVATQAGMGLLRQYEDAVEVVGDSLAVLVDSDQPPNAEQLEEVSAGNGLVVTRKVVESIREEPARDSIITRLASEVALARTLEEALFARRALLAGRKEANIANAELAQKEIQNTIDELNGEIENMLFELDVRSRIAGNTTLPLLTRRGAKRALPVGEDEESIRLNDGGVRVE